jgi:catechol 2,3-dioxygenase-like lactoylglutathione lyase family enzyme
VVNYLGNTRFPGMGYILQRAFWGQGITAEACGAALTFGFDTCGFDRVELWIDENNHASQRVAAKLGFTLRGQLALRYAHEANHHKMLVFGQWAETWRGEVRDSAETRFFSVEPVLLVHDVAATAAFYRDKLGFNVDFLYGNPPFHGGVSRGDWSGSGVVIQLSQAPPEHAITPAGYLYIVVDTGLDQLHATYTAAGVDIVESPKSYPWGMREFAIRDLNGHRLQFGTHA